MGQEFINNAADHGGASQSVRSVFAPGLTELEKRDVSNTLDYASYQASAMVPEGRVSWLWFHYYISEIIKLGWTARTTGPGNVDLKQMPGVRTVADLATELANADHTSNSGWQLTQGVLGLFGNSESSECKKSFTLTGVRLKDGVLTMQMVGLGVQYTKTSNIIGEELSSTKQVQREIVDFTADQPFLGAHRKELEEKLREIAEKDAINIEL